MGERDRTVAGEAFEAVVEEMSGAVIWGKVRR